MEKKENTISLLLNAGFYFLQRAFIMKGNDGKRYRLVVIHNNRVIIDHDYRTLRGAKIGCAKTVQCRGFKGKLKTEWSPFYVPGAKWLEDRLKGN